MHLLILTVCFETPALFAVGTKSFPISCSSRRKLNQDFCRLLAFFPFVYRDSKNVKILHIYRIMFHRWGFLLFNDQRKLSRKQRISVNRWRKRRIEKYYSFTATRRFALVIARRKARQVFGNEQGRNKDRWEVSGIGCKKSGAWSRSRTRCYGVQRQERYVCINRTRRSKRKQKQAEISVSKTAECLICKSKFMSSGGRAAENGSSEFDSPPFNTHTSTTR